jgi:hypothetical protein
MLDLEQKAINMKQLQTKMVSYDFSTKIGINKTFYSILWLKVVIVGPKHQFEEKSNLMLLDCI